VWDEVADSLTFTPSVCFAAKQELLFEILLGSQ